MIELLGVLIAIGLIDSTSIVPLCIFFLIGLLAGPRPLVGSSAFILGVFVAYLICGFLLLFGLQSLFDAINEYAMRVWQSPKTEELIFQIILGLVLCAFGWRIARARKKRPAKDPDRRGTSPTQAALAGAGITIVGLPGAVPYFAAIDLILRSEVPLSQQILALVVYNLAFVAALIVIIALGLSLGSKGTVILHKIREFLDTWSQRVIVALLMILGVVLVADGIGWFLGYPLIPV